MDRFDLKVDVPPVGFQDLDLPAAGDTSAVVAERVRAARDVQQNRFDGIPGVRVNSDASGALLEKVATPDADGKALLLQAAERVGLSARGYHRVMRVARTIADLSGHDEVGRTDVAEAISFRLGTQS